MDKKKKENGIANLRKKYKKLEDQHKELEGKHKELEEKYLDINSSAASIISQVKKIQKISEYKDINNRMSEQAQKTIQDSKGPLKPNMLCKYLMNDVFGKRYKKAVLKKYSEDTQGVRRQLSQVLENVQLNMEYRKAQEKLDANFVKTIKKLDKNIEGDLAKEKKQPKEKKNNLKQQDNAKNAQFNGHGSEKVKDQLSFHNTRYNYREKKVEYDSQSSQESQSSQITGERTRKRKVMFDTESASCSSQESDAIGRYNGKRKVDYDSDNSNDFSPEYEMLEVTERCKRSKLVSRQNSSA